MQLITIRCEEHVYTGKYTISNKTRIGYVVLALAPLALFFISEITWQKGFPSRMQLPYWLLNIGIFAIVCTLFCSVLPVKLALILLSVFCYGYSVVNYYVTLFRGSPIMPVDFKTVGTAMAVANQYSYPIKGQMIAGAVILIAWIIVVVKLVKVPRIQSGIVRTGGRIALLVFSIEMIFAVATTNFSTRVYGIHFNLFDPLPTYRNAGYILSFISNWQVTQIEEPEGYSPETVRKILEEYQKNDNTDKDKETSQTKIKPYIIAIMNESFSDISVNGPIEDQADILPFLYSLKDDP